MRIRFLAIVILFLTLQVSAQNTVPKTTRIHNTEQHIRQGEQSYPYREWSDYIISELDIRTGDAVLDIGTGDGWWIDQIIKHTGEYATIYALEIEEDKVNELKKKYEDKPFIRPVLAPKDGTGMKENSVDLVFFSQVYHHLPENSHVGYLKHLKSVVKPTGRIAVIERYTEIAVYGKDHGTQLSALIEQAEEAGWILLRYELIPNTFHYLTLFAQKELFKKADEPPKEEPKELTHTADTVAEVKAAVKNGKALIIDVRELNEWDEGHLTDAYLLPMSKLNTITEDEKAMDEAKKILGKDKIIYTHCRRGGRALRAGELLKTMGYDVRPLKLGFEELVEQGLEPAKSK